VIRASQALLDGVEAAWDGEDSANSEDEDEEDETVKQGDVLPYGWRRLGATSRSAFLKAVREDVKEIVKGGWPTRLPDTLYERELLPPDLDLSKHTLTYHLRSRKDCVMAALSDAYADNAIELEVLSCGVGKQFMSCPSSLVTCLAFAR
jgi:hypothetical protein